MKLSIIPLCFLLAAAPVAVHACEGECIVAITNAFLGNYSYPITAVLNDIAGQISQKITHTQPNPPLKYLAPLIEAYNKAAYPALEFAIFPSYFHGKCQNADGVDPKGCPDPDCPVVCGTPGSLVHFYGKLRSIAYEETSKLLVTLTTPGNETYKEIEKAVVADTQGHSARMFGFIQASGLAGSHRKREDIPTELKKVLGEMGSLVAKACGEGQKACSWEDAMKKYILSFP